MYKIELIASFLDHQCVNPKHSITQKQTVKSHHNTRSPQQIPTTARKKIYTRTAAYKQHNDLKEMDMSTKTYQNSCLQKVLRIKRDKYFNKYTNPRKAETTTPEYITIIQD